jgi:ABC-type sugar transport system ATPase subunit
LIEVQHITVKAGDFELRDLSLTVPEGKYGVLMGKTGSGKTTLLEAIIGLRRVQAGRIVLAGRDVTRLRPSLRAVGYVPQDGALFSRMTVRDHLAFALEVRGAKHAAIRRRVDELADLLGIRPLLNRTPRNLSGGERQRVALGRALSFSPRILLLDEPLSALDEETRHQTYDLLTRIHRSAGATALHVTHSQNEADRLGDCVFRIENGTELSTEK